jgi:iron(III) transport system permease protein
MSRSGNETYSVSATGLVIDRYILTGVTILIGFLLVFFMLFPIYKILVMSFFREGVVGLENFTLANYVKYFGTPRIAKSLYNSVYVSLMTMAITTIVAFFFAYALTRTTIRGKGFSIPWPSCRSLPRLSSRPWP